MNSNVDFYEAFASDYEAYYAGVDAPEAVRQWLEFLEREKLIPALESRLLRPFSLLDVGCGPGLHLRSWQQAGFRVAGLDSSPAMLNLAAKNVTAGVDTDIPLYCANIQDVKSLKSLYGQFDLATAHFNFLNLFPSEQLSSVFSGIAALIKREGLWITDLTSISAKCQDVPDPGQSKHFGWHSTQKIGADNRQVFWKSDKQQLKETYWFHSLENIKNLCNSVGLNMINYASWYPAADSLWIRKTGRSSRIVLVFMRD